MPRFFIEVPHPEETVACARVIQVFLQTGSHFLRNADWGCMDGEHKAWIILEADSKEEARNVVPPTFRPDARVTQLTTFTPEQIEEILRNHGAAGN